MNEETIPLLQFRNGRQIAWLYYYRGNFHHPLDFATKEMGWRVKNLIKAFMRTHRDLVKADRAHPDYRDVYQLAEEQGVFVGCE